MKKIMKVLVLSLAMVVLVGSGISVFANNENKKPSDIYADLTNQQIDDVIDKKQQSNKTYGMMAYDDGVFEDFKSQMYQLKTNEINALVAEGKMDQKTADEYLERLLVDCTGNPYDNQNRQNNDNTNQYGKNNLNTRHRNCNNIDQ